MFQTTVLHKLLVTPPNFYKILKYQVVYNKWSIVSCDGEQRGCNKGLHWNLSIFNMFVTIVWYVSSKICMDFLIGKLTRIIRQNLSLSLSRTTYSLKMKLDINLKHFALVEIYQRQHTHLRTEIFACKKLEKNQTFVIDKKHKNWSFQ